MSVDQNIAQPGKKAGRYSMELLAPAGDREALEAALNAGADAEIGGASGWDGG